MRTPRLLFLVPLTLAALAAGCSSSPSPSPTTHAPTTTGGVLGGAADLSTPAAALTGAGASSAQQFLTRVFYEYGLSNHAVSVNYSPAGSSVGISDLEVRAVDFGQSEVPMTAADQAKAQGGAVLQVPVDLSGVALAYNVPGAADHVKLTPAEIAGIYLGTVTDWHTVDSSIPAGEAVVPVHRADSSGPGYDLDQYLIDTVPAWVSAIGTSKASESWPKADVGVGEQLNSGVADYVKETPGAIGFVAYSYAVQDGLDVASLLNKAGTYVLPSNSSIAAAGHHATALSAQNFNIVNEPGHGTYPLANFSWTIVYQHQTDTQIGIALGKLLDWVTTRGQRYASALGYAPLPANVRTVAHTTLLQLKDATGTPLFSS